MPGNANQTIELTICDVAGNCDTDTMVAFASCPCAGNEHPLPICPEEHLEITVDDNCDWTLEPAFTAIEATDPDGHPVELIVEPAIGHGLDIRGAQISAIDVCGTLGRKGCIAMVTPRDRHGPTMEVGAVSQHRLADDWIQNWTNVVEGCQIAIQDNCTSDITVMHGIIGVESSDPDEVIEGAPGFFFSDRFLADWAGFMLDLDGHLSGAIERTYTLSYAAVDEHHNMTTVQCIVEITE